MVKTYNKPLRFAGIFLVLCIAAVAMFLSMTEDIGNFIHEGNVEKSPCQPHLHGKIASP